MSWVKENCLSFFQSFCIKVVKTGRVPQHIAFIMDGNRRYAKKQCVDTSAGHHKGFDKLSETLKWCLDLGIPEVTVYAFSIENFKRSTEEVNALMDLAKEKFEKLIEELAQIQEWGIRVCVAGRLALLPAELRALAARATLATRHNSQLRLNIAYAYTGRDEIGRAAGALCSGVRRGELPPATPAAQLLAAALDLAPPDLLVRTSGEVRLSDFMLWQVSDTVLYFTGVLWPEFTVWSLLRAVLHFQRVAPPAAEPPRAAHPAFLSALEERRWAALERHLTC